MPVVERPARDPDRQSMGHGRVPQTTARDLDRWTKAHLRVPQPAGGCCPLSTVRRHDGLRERAADCGCSAIGTASDFPFLRARSRRRSSVLAREWVRGQRVSCLGGRSERAPGPSARSEPGVMRQIAIASAGRARSQSDRRVPKQNARRRWPTGATCPFWIFPKPDIFSQVKRNEALSRCGHRPPSRATDLQDVEPGETVDRMDQGARVQHHATGSGMKKPTSPGAA